MEVLIVGAGAIGCWFGEMIDDPVFADRDPSVAKEAAATVGGRTVDLDTTESFETVSVAVPMPAATTAIARFAKNATTAIIDFTGAMTDPLTAMDQHASSLEHASFHPLFAPENAPGNIPVARRHPGPITDEIIRRLEAHHNTVVETTAAAHDTAMETVQAKTHAAILAFALAADDVDEIFQTPIYQGLIGLVSEMTGGNPRVYADIQEVFDGADAVAAAARKIAEADRETYQSLYRDAGE